MRNQREKVTLMLVLGVGISLLLLMAKVAPATTDQGASQQPDCAGQKSLTAKAYSTYRWWSQADPSPASAKEDSRLDGYHREGCPDSVRRERKENYSRFYRKVIAPCQAVGQRWANCAVAQCESGFGTGGSSIYGFTVYWAAIPVLPVRGNRTGTRFAPSSFSATKIQQDVVAAAAFRYGPTPGTCAS